MERDRSYRDRLSKKINPFKIVPKISYNKLNKEKAWEYRRYPEFDVNFCCISLDGTLGDIFKIGNLYIGLPSSEGKEIINFDKSDDDAKWERVEPPVAFDDLWFDYKNDMASASVSKRNSIRSDFVRKRNILVEKHQDFVDEEFHKRKYGVFIKIDNEVHYMTGENWLFLSHYYLTESNMYGYFRIPAMECYWHWEGVKADDSSWGEIRGKGRRTSWSVESASMALNVFTLTKYANIPIVSERKDLAGKLFTGKIVKSFEYYPIYFKPLIPLPSKEIKTDLSISFETKRKEESQISYYPTKLTAYDSTKVKNLSINDEIGKWEDTSLVEFLSRHSKCHTEGGAKARCGSTAGDYLKGGGQEFEIEFLDADANKRSRIGRTGNGLVSLFVDVCYTMTQPISYFDKWGHAVVKDPKEPIWNESGKHLLECGAITDWDITYENLAKAKGPKAKAKLNAFMRDMPRTIEHMFRNEGGTKNDFDITNLNNHLEYLRKYTEEDLVDTVYRGNLTWTGEPFDSEVEWRPNVNGKFFTTWVPPKDLQNKWTSKVFMGKNVKTPLNNHIGCFGVDSYDIMGNLKDKSGSDGAIVGYSKFSQTGCPSQSFFLKYKERPDKRNDFYDDVIKACQFFGMYALVESNKARLLEYMYDKGYTGYAMRRQDKKWRHLNDAEKLWGGMPSSIPVIEDQASLLKDYILDYVGQNLEDDCKVWFIDMIKEWINFDLNNRKLFDLGVASGFALMGSQYKVKQRANVDEAIHSGGITLSSFGA